MTKELVIERLSYIKYLYQLGDQQSQQPYKIAFSSILCFHDAIDLFNQLAAEYLRKSDQEIRNITGGQKRSLYMMEYFDLIPELKLKPSVKKLNDRRNSLKHNGEIPSSSAIEESRIVCKMFFEENTLVIFNIDFNTVSLLFLVENPEVKNFLINSETYLNEEKWIECAEEVSKAFYVLTFIDSNDYSGSKFGYHLKNRISTPRVSSIRNLDRSLEGILENHNKNFQKISEAFMIISLGIDYRKYVKFELLTPEIYKRLAPNKNLGVYRNKSEKLLTKEKCQFLIDFVLECALKVQSFRFE